MIIVYVQNNKRSSPYYEDVDQLPLQVNHDLTSFHAVKLKKFHKHRIWLPADVFFVFTA